MTISHTCSCGATIDVSVTFGEDAQTYGPPERCHDGSSDAIEPDECPECGERLNQESIMEDAARIIEDRETERAIQREEDRREARYL